MVKTIAFHSYKGGTGKTTIAANLSTLLVSKGFNVLLIDMDVYAPSLHVYFNSKPDRWINNYTFWTIWNLPTLFMTVLMLSKTFHP